MMWYILVVRCGENSRHLLIRANFLFSSSDGESELEESSMVTETELPEKHSDLPAGMFTPNALPPITKGGPLNNNNNNTGKDRQLSLKILKILELLSIPSYE